ncbi:MAG: hypothetical protein WBK65_08525, partial [Thermotogota bacterium]
MGERFFYRDFFDRLKNTRLVSRYGVDGRISIETGKLKEDCLMQPLDMKKQFGIFPMPIVVIGTLHGT